MTDKAMPKPGPNASPVSAPFWENARNHRLTLQYCDDCQRWVFYPRARCPYCWSDALSWRDASGEGTVAARIIVHKPGHPAFLEDVPYVVALIDLAEGPRMLSNVVDCHPDAVEVGMPVRLRWTERENLTLPTFAPAGAKEAQQ
ncbi:Zn-ribbon domain-containing OB-fold protein [Spiribacter halobius]|uniref:DNA-binding protein n=1 Tax=Sediminicurvatus halobius TaxID=2182432 RepID=A0A2U2MXE1_9GAMM|nr:Zn-ribbon domain-containing OB-fold protein [Spiribacter halobius]PWG61535.1 hypothetical protein DEM34_16025 [Spiribacter halobius]UEX78014.1 Zn-ribbon domain-containing OB-fold protein [Spiribacter halobius]